LDNFGGRQVGAVSFLFFYQAVSDELKMIIEQ